MRARNKTVASFDVLRVTMVTGVVTRRTC